MAGQYIEAVLFTRLLNTASTSAAAYSLQSLCAVCHAWGAQRVCEVCVKQFVRSVPRCELCADAVPPGVTQCGACLKQPPPASRTLAAVDYLHPWDGLITRFKFHAALDLAPALTQRLIDMHRHHGAPPPGLLLPMPLAEQRLRERGYNQAWELTRRLAAALRCASDARLLLRIKDTPHQLALAPSERAANVRGAFAIEPRRRAEVQEREITLIDDVLTTGATVDEAARVLLQAGAASVQVWVVARTPRHATL